MPASCAGLPAISKDEIRWVRLWEKAEDVAMHFNQLIMNFRLKALGAVTVGVGLIGATLLTKEGAVPQRHNFILAMLATGLLGVGWLAIAAIDSGYYSRLLRGAVAELLRLEKESHGVIRLSTEIERVAKGKRFSDRWARRTFYILPGLALLSIIGVICWRIPAR